MTGIDPSMFELFREEARAHAGALSGGLVELEADPTNPQRIEPLMRAAHSLKGAARIVGIDPAVRIAHGMEDALVAAQAGRLRITSAHIDILLQGADALAALGRLSDAGLISDWVAGHDPLAARLEPVFRAMAEGKLAVAPQPVSAIAGGQREREQDIHPRSGAESVSDGRADTDPWIGRLHPSSATTRGPEPHPSPASMIAQGLSPPPDFPPPPPHESIVIPAEPVPLTGDHGMLDLFREEVRSHLLVLASGIDAIATGGVSPGDNLFESLREIRGSARVMKCPPVEAAAAATAEFLTAVRESRVPLTPAGVGWLRYTTSLLSGLIGVSEESFVGWLDSVAPALERAATQFRNVASAPRPTPPPAAGEPAPMPLVFAPEPPAAPLVSPAPLGKPELHPEGPVVTPVVRSGAGGEGVVRVTARSLNRLMGLAGESLVQARWLHLFSTSLLKLKKQHEHLAGMLDVAFQAAASGQPDDQIAQVVADTRRHAGLCREQLADQAADFDDHAARAEDLNSRLYREVIASRMRPFADCAHGMSRMVRDMARALGKQARLVVVGENTDVDRDVLEKLESPLTHLIRNAVDHGIEAPGERTAGGKPEAGTVRVEARHRAGMLSVAVADDGRGVDLPRLRQKVVDRGLSAADLVRQMSDAELLEFLFLPGFTTAGGVTEFSGRGVGLDVVQDTVRRIGGSVRITTRPGEGTTFQLQLPITLSVIRAVVVDVGTEPYAFPHNRIDRLLRVPRATVRSLEHRQFAAVDGQNVGLVLAGQLLDVPADPPKGDDMPVVLLSDATGAYGLVVDAIRGEQDLVVRPLDPRLGKVPNLSAAAVLDDGEPVLIVDVEDLVRSMDQFIQTGSLRRCEVREAGPTRKKRVLVVDDSITVREVERQLLAHHGYEVAVAVDGMDGWNQVRAGRYDLLVTDVDMPRMTGLQLVQAVRADEKFRNLPVIIVSYKEREEDRLRGLQVGANSYLTKSSFHDNRFVRAVEDLIGSA
ncbi:MAG: chemotaxis protein histidine kinaselike protein [Gemmataceae bacterium]|nr:chemotaxis protein histidine kinaselike protein [Gemmataceae bacterium]